MQPVAYGAATTPLTRTVSVILGASYTTGRMQYALNLTNVTDRQYWTSSLGNRQLYPGQPFNVLATVRVRMD